MTVIGFPLLSDAEMVTAAGRSTYPLGAPGAIEPSNTF